MIRFAFQEDGLGKLKENILGMCEAEGREMEEEASAQKQQVYRQDAGSGSRMRAGKDFRTTCFCCCLLAKLCPPLL